MPSDLSLLLLRDLDGVKAELAAYPDDEGPWAPVPGLSNPAGTLALHVAGNLQHFVGAALGGTGYVRDRDAEFARRDVPRRELVAELERAQVAVRQTLASLDPGRLGEPFPEEFVGMPLATDRFLLHLVTHLAYHLGQIDVHRRVVTGEARGLGVVSVKPLAIA